MGKSVLNEGGKKAIDNPLVNKVVSQDHMEPQQYEEKTDDGLRMNPQPLKQKGDAEPESNPDTDLASKGASV